MAEGIGPKEGYDIYVDGVYRTFRDRRSAAIDSAIYYKSRHQDEIVMIRDRETGQEMLVLPDGRLG